MSHPCYVCAYEPVPDGEGVECAHCHRLQYGSVCPYCQKSAPTVLRNGAVTCSACARPRGPIEGGIPLNIAGKPSQLGGTVARGFGWVALVGGWLTALALWAIAGGIPTTTGLGSFFHAVFLVVAVLMALGGTSVGATALYGGKWLRARGDHAQRSAREQALFAVARLRGGLLSAVEAATALNLQHAEADALLTTLAQQGVLGVEVDASGTVYYVFREVRALQNLPAQPGPQLRAAPMQTPVAAPGSTGVRVEMSTAPTQMATPQEEARANVDAEYQRLKTLSGYDPSKRS